MPKLQSDYPNYLAVRIGDKSHATLVSRAKSMGITTSDLVRQILDIYTEAESEFAGNTRGKPESQPKTARHIIRPKVVKRETNPGVWYEDETRAQRKERITKHVNDTLASKLGKLK